MANSIVQDYSFHICQLLTHDGPPSVEHSKVDRFINIDFHIKASTLCCIMGTAVMTSPIKSLSAFMAGINLCYGVSKYEAYNIKRAVE